MSLDQHYKLGDNAVSPTSFLQRGFGKVDNKLRAIVLDDSHTRDPAPTALKIRSVKTGFRTIGPRYDNDLQMIIVDDFYRTDPSLTALNYGAVQSGFLPALTAFTSPFWADLGAEITAPEWPLQLSPVSAPVWEASLRIEVENSNLSKKGKLTAQAAISACAQTRLYPPDLVFSDDGSVIIEYNTGTSIVSAKISDTDALISSVWPTGEALASFFDSSNMEMEFRARLVFELNSRSAWGEQSAEMASYR